MASNAADGNRLTGKQLAFVHAYTDPADPETFGNATRAAIKAGYSPRKARDRGYRLLKLPKIRSLIAKLQVQVQDKLAIARADYVLMLLEQADSWKDPETGHPKQKLQRYFYKGRELACDAYDVMPGMAQFKALELVGKILGYVPDRRDAQPFDVSCHSLSVLGLGNSTSIFSPKRL